MGHYFAIRKDESMQLTAMWIDLESIMFNGIRQREKDKLKMISLIYDI